MALYSDLQMSRVVHSEKWTENSSDSYLPDRHLLMLSGKWKAGKQKSGQEVLRSPRSKVTSEEKKGNSFALCPVEGQC